MNHNFPVAAEMETTPEVAQEDNTYNSTRVEVDRIPDSHQEPTDTPFHLGRLLSDNPFVKLRGITSEVAVLAQMFFDLNVPIPILQPPGHSATATQSKKGKAKQIHTQQPELSFSPVQIASIENRVELLIHRPS